MAADLIELKGMIEAAMPGSSAEVFDETGTGDHRLEVYAANGTVIESKVMNRTATFAFYLGARFFGVMTVFVPGEAAGKFHFTSAIAVQIIKDMEPALRPLVLGNETPEPSWDELVASFEAENASPQGSPPIVGTLPMSAPDSPPQTPPTPAKAAATNSVTPPKTVVKPPAKPEIKVPAVTPSEPPPAPPPPQIDKPDPPPPPPAPPPAKTVPREPKPNPWLGQEGEGFNFVR